MSIGYANETSSSAKVGQIHLKLQVRGNGGLDRLQRSLSVLYYPPPIAK